MRGPLASSSAERSRFATSRTAPSTPRAPLGARGAAIRSGPATKPPFTTDRPESEDESKTCAATRFDEASKSTARTARAADAGTASSGRKGFRAWRHWPDHHAGQPVGTRSRAQCSHAGAVLGRAEISPPLVSRRPCRLIGIDRSQSHLCNRPRRLFRDGEDGKANSSIGKDIGRPHKPSARSDPTYWNGRCAGKLRSSRSGRHWAGAVARKPTPPRSNA